MVRETEPLKTRQDLGHWAGGQTWHVAEKASWRSGWTMKTGPITAVLGKHSQEHERRVSKMEQGLECQVQKGGGGPDPSHPG